MRTPLILVGLVVFVASMPGCIAWEIRDEIRGVNARLETVEASLASVNAELTDIEVQLVDVGSTIHATNAHLDVVKGDLGTTKSSLGSVDVSLGSVDEQLRLLRQVQSSLSRLDTHLASLRTTINRIDGAIPFLSLGGGDEVIEAPPMESAEGDTDEDALVAGGEGETSEAVSESRLRPTRSDPLLGVWMSAKPDDGMTLIVQPGNRYIIARPLDDAQDTREEGDWARSGDKFTLKPGRSSESTAEERGWTIVLQTMRSLTVDDGRQIRVFVKP